MSGTDSITMTTVVPADPATAFGVFTEEVDGWWKTGPRFRSAGGTMRFEPGEGGRLIETRPDGTEFRYGRISVWKPGVRAGTQGDQRDRGEGLSRGRG